MVLIAAERMGRRCCGMELDPLYADTIIRRWQALTGDAAVHGTCGETFDAQAATVAEVPPAGANDAVQLQVREAGHAA